MTFFASLFGLSAPGLLMFFADNPKISFGIYDIAKSLTIPGWIVIFILLVEAVYMIAVGIERWLTYNKAHSNRGNTLRGLRRPSRTTTSTKQSVLATSTKIRTSQWSFRPA